MIAGTARIDWYQSTHDDLDDERVAPTLAMILRGTVNRGKARYGYAVCQEVHVGDEVLAQVYGRSARLGEVHVVVTSSACDVVVPILRRLWPEHRVARADAALDFAASFEEIDARALAFAEQRRVSYRLVTNSEGGATRYLGSPSSEVMVRIYKKSEQLLALHPDAAERITPGIVRAEVQVRPGKRPIKEAAAHMTPENLWGLSQWSADLAAAVLDLDPVRVSTHFRRPSDYSRMLHFLGLQYGPGLQERIKEAGREAVVADVLDALALAPAVVSA